MGIFDALTTAVTGLQAQSFALQNISGNIANSQTTGYKETDTAFQDLVSQAALGKQTAGGVLAGSVATNTVQGSIQSSTVATNMAINGDGFFIVAKPAGITDNAPTFSGVQDYTRAGDFQLNSNGYLVNSSGYYLMGIPVNAQTGNPEGSVPEVLQFDNNFVPAQATTAINYQANLPSTPTSGVLTPSSFEANPLAGAASQAEIQGTGASLKQDAEATGTSTVNNLSSGTTLASLGMSVGQTFTVSDGTNTTTYTMAAGDTVGTLMTAINGGSTSGTIGIALNPPAGPGSLVLTAKNDNDLDTIQVGGTAASTLGFGTGNLSFSPINLLTQNAVSEGQTLTVTVGSGTTQTITFGTGAGEVATLAELQTKLSGLTGLGTATVVQSGTGTGDITLQATSPSASLTVGGTASAAKFGIENLTALPANGTVIANDSSAFDSQSISGGSITAYDSEGNPVNVSFRWAQTSSGSGTSSWQLFYESDTAATGTESQWTNVGTTFNFNSSGEMSPAISGLTLANLSVNGDSLGNVQLQFGNNGLTQFANTSGTTQVSQLQQNGFASGELQSISVDTQNRVVGTFSNGQTIALAQVTLATFNGANSLQALSGQAYAATPESGQPNYSATGTIEGSSLEGSNVDIATQFSQLIVAQQAYSANARVMTTSDQMIQSLLQVIQ